MASFGSELGGYVEVPTFKPTAPYDPRVRPWYQHAINFEGPYFSEPYQTSVTKELVFAVSQAVKLNSKPVGVVSLTIKLDTLLEEINKQDYGHEGYINILSPSNRFINSPHNAGWLLKAVDEIENTPFSNVAQHHASYFEGVIDHEEMILNVFISPYSGWQYISVVNKASVLRQSTVLTSVFMSIYLVTLVIISLLIYAISSYITKPILQIAHAIHEMASFKFDQYQSKDFTEYRHLNDEIGDITRALANMQVNYLEANNTLNTMDAEIKSIDVQQHSEFKLNLSQGNPFSFIMSSVNGLLEKVYRYIDQITEINQEMTQKNELLVASEEELTAQLEEIESQKEIIRFLADHDPLTDLPNRRIFYDALRQSLKNQKSGTVVMLDLDNFKGINDTLGHVYGDKVLQYVAHKLRDTAPKNAFVSRFGGDEFLILLEYSPDENNSLTYIKTLQEMFKQRIQIGSHEVIIEFSIGVTSFPEDSCNMDELVMFSDLALYHVKNSGKNNFAFYDQAMSDQLKSNRIIKDTLRDAIENEGFKLLYQPLVDIKTGTIYGYEALLRLKNLRFNPGDFIPIAEEDSMILTIGRLVTEMAIRQMQEWHSKGLSPRNMSINFSALQIHDHAYKDFLLDCLKTCAINPSLITLEITENIFLENRESTIQLLNDLRLQGIRIAVDDFGTGYSSLSYLTELPIDSIKLDRTLGTKFLELENIGVMDSLIALAHSLKLTVVAEGIESYEQVRRLKVGKCDIIQGYYFSKPLDAEEIEAIYHKAYEI